MAFDQGSEETRFLPEILDCVFSHLEHPCKYDEASDMSWDEWNQITEFRPQSSLYPLLFVSKEWHGIAHRRLYHTVGIGGGFAVGGDDEDDGDEELEHDVGGKFFDAVTANPHLSSLVRVLLLRTCNRKRALGEILKYMRIIYICENVEIVSLCISKWSNLFSARLRNALEGKDLVELYVSKRSEDDKKEYTSLSDVTSYLIKWPRLRKIWAKGVFSHDGSRKALLDPLTLRGHCSVLREITLQLDVISADQMLLLSEMAPNVEAFAACVAGASSAAYRICLQAWSTTLIDLAVDSGDYSVIDNESACPSLSALRVFASRALHVQPQTLVNFIRLESLEYLCTANELAELADILAQEDPILLPCLRKLELMPDGHFWDYNIDATASRRRIQRTCAERNISLFEHPMFDNYESE